MKVRRNILCIDVGFRNTGVAVWDVLRRRFIHTAIYSFPKCQEHYVLLESMRVVRGLTRRLVTIIGRFNPAFVIAELPFGGARNSRAGTCMALAVGAVITVCALHELRLESIRPQQIKKWVGGHGNRKVPKSDVIARVRQEFGTRLLPDSSKAEHVADAMACLAVWRTRKTNAN